jgi:hypothetical protein
MGVVGCRCGRFVGGGAVSTMWLIHRPPALTDKDTIVLADFTNSTRDPIFDCSRCVLHHPA